MKILYLFTMQSYRKEVICNLYKEYLKNTETRNAIPETIFGMLEGLIPKQKVFWESFVSIGQEELIKIEERIYTANFQMIWNKVFESIDLSQIMERLTMYFNSIVDLEKLMKSNVIINPSVPMYFTTEELNVKVAVKRKRLFCRMLDVIYILHQDFLEEKFYMEDED